MNPLPKIFISATSGDLGSIRQIVKEALLTINCHPVEQTTFELDWRTVGGMLRAKITDCQAMIHIAGLRYGAEPDLATLPDGTPRRSYTQMEYDIGRQLHEERGDGGFRVYDQLLANEDFAYQNTLADERAVARVELIAGDAGGNGNNSGGANKEVPIVSRISESPKLAREA